MLSKFELRSLAATFANGDGVALRHGAAARSWSLVKHDVGIGKCNFFFFKIYTYFSGINRLHFLTQYKNNQTMSTVYLFSF